MSLRISIIFALLTLLTSAVLGEGRSEFFERVNYKGAYGSTNWSKGWTAMDHYGYFTDDPESSQEVVVTDSDINAGDVVYWTADKTYVLDGFVYAEEGAVLNIEAGTIVKAKPGQGESASALIICRGAKIFAEGTATKPIIFTAESDDVTDPYDLQLPTTNLWGGLILLGKAPINTSAGEGKIEGIPPTEDRIAYGGDDPEDCSGVLRYVSIRHGGTDIGEGKEINGLTLGAVGRGTTIDYIEVFNNNDDGFEWFGGTVNCKHLISAFNVDDAFDHDEGLQTKIQYALVIQSEDIGNRCGEHDGGTEPEDGTPYAHPVIYNATYLGSGQSSANAENDYLFKIRDNWGGEYKNCIFGDFPGIAMDVEDLESGADSRERMENGDIQFKNNIWFNFGGGSDWATLGKHDWESAYLSNASNANVLSDPQLGGVSRTNDKGFDPRPATTGPAYQDLADYVVTDVKENTKPGRTFKKALTLAQNYPNPFNPVTTISFTIAQPSKVNLTVFNMMGQKVETLVDENLNSGSFEVQWQADKYPSGLYFYRIQTNEQVISKKMMFLK